jgi:outer membrane protein, multidrug efflux system
VRRHQALELTLTAQTAALSIARDQYSHGTLTFINVLSAETNVAQQHAELTVLKPD